MCRPASEGGRRCIGTRALRALSMEQLRPPPGIGGAEVDWPDDSPAAILERHGAAGAQALAVLVHVREVEPQMTADFMAALPEGVRADGLAYRVKSPTSLARKIDDRMETGLLSPAAAAEKCQDVVRYTAVVPTSGRLVSTARAVVEGLQGKGWTVREAEQSYTDAAGKPTKGTAYKGLHLLLERDQVVCEVQIHSEESMAAKHDTHAKYELERDRSVPRAQRADAHASMVARWSHVVTPRGISALTELGGAPVHPKNRPNPYATASKGDRT